MRSAWMVPVVIFAPLMVVLPAVLRAEIVTYPERSILSATNLTARSVMVKSEADVPDFTSQLILFAVCVTEVMLPSAVSMRVLKLFTVCVSVETEPSAFSIRVLNPLTV